MFACALCPSHLCLHVHPVYLTCVCMCILSISLACAFCLSHLRVHSVHLTWSCVCVCTLSISLVFACALCLSHLCLRVQSIHLTWLWLWCTDSRHVHACTHPQTHTTHLCIALHGLAGESHELIHCSSTAAAQSHGKNGIHPTW
jgi:hypothetical protein